MNHDDHGDDRYQVSVVLSGELKEKWERALLIERRKKADLLRIVIEDWLLAYEQNQSEPSDKEEDSPGGLLAFG